MADCRPVTDGDRIRNLLGRYCDLMDAGDWPGIGALFARGRLVTEDGTELAAGAGDERHGLLAPFERTKSLTA